MGPNDASRPARRPVAGPPAGSGDRRRDHIVRQGPPEALISRRPHHRLGDPARHAAESMDRRKQAAGGKLVLPLLWMGWLNRFEPR